MPLEVAGVSKAYGGVAAVSSCSLRVDEDEIVGLIGPNGAGKTTLINLISGFDLPDAGSVHLDGEDVTSHGPHRRARRGLVRTFQLARVWGRLSVLENLLVAGANPAREALWKQWVLGRHLHRAEADDRRRAREILAELDLLRLKDQPARELSGGQQRLLEFARILMARPRVVLLDEPSASLSPAMSERVAEGIRTLASRHISVLLVEHDLPLVEAVTTRVVCMASGSVLAEGTLAALRRNPAVLEAYLGAGAIPRRSYGTVSR